MPHDYILLRGLQQQLALTYDNLKSQEDTLELTKSRFNAGLTSDLDVANAEAQVATTAAEVPTLEIQIRQTMHQLAILLGQEPMALSLELGKKGIIPPSPSEIPVGIPSELLRRRPDVRQAERSLQSATANIGVAVAELFPRFSLTGTLGQESGKFSLIARADSTYWSIGPSVTWRILDFGNLRNQIRVTNLLQEQALLTYKGRRCFRALAMLRTRLVAYAEDQKGTRAAEMIRLLPIKGPWICPSSFIRGGWETF